MGDEDPTVAETLNNLAFLLHDKGDYEAVKSCIAPSLGDSREKAVAPKARPALVRNDRRSTSFLLANALVSLLNGR